MNVKLIRMSSGEDIVATVVNDGNEFITIRDAIVAIPTSQGKVGFAPWSPLISKENEEIKVRKDFLVYVADVNSDILEQYKQMFSTIITPETKKLIM